MRLNSLEHRFVEISEFDDDVKIINPTAEDYRAYMIKELNKLKWRKIDCSIDYFNSHASIVQRNPSIKVGGDVVSYLIEEILSIEWKKSH